MKLLKVHWICYPKSVEESPKRKQRWLSMVEVQDVFNEFGVIYRQSHKLPLHIHKAMNAIEKCRSSALGSHTDICDSCGFHKISYNSCTVSYTHLTLPT